MKQFRWGIIGPGRIAQKFADCVQALPNSEVAAIASRSSKDLTALAQKMHAARAYDSYDALVKDDGVDAVYIATPHNFHFENAMLCISHDKPTLVEKTFTVNAREAQALVDAGRQKGVFLMEAMWTRFLPVFQQVRRWLESGKIGDVKLVTSTLGFLAKRDLRDRLLNPNLAGGTVLDLGIYCMAASQDVFKEYPTGITARGFIGETGVDETISVNLDYGNGRFSDFICTFLVQPPTHVEISGTKGRIIVHPLFYSSEYATLVTASGEKKVHLPQRINGFEYEIEEAQRCIRKGKLESPLLPLVDTINNLRVLDEIRSQIGMRYMFEKR